MASDKRYSFRPHADQWRAPTFMLLETETHE